MAGNVAGGDDAFKLAGFQSNFTIYGDAGGNMSKYAVGGNDAVR